MKYNSKTNDSVEHRIAPRSYIDIFYSVELTIVTHDNMSQCYQFKLRNISESGMCILVSEKSEIMNYLEIGDALNIKYCPSDTAYPEKNMKTKIKHITYVPKQGAPENGHYYIGLFIMEKEST